MTGHPPVIEIGPGTVRRLCCGGGDPAERATTALDCIDDPVALVDGQPVAVPALWRSVLRAVACPGRRCAPRSMLIVHPTWWSTRRVELVAAAARPLADLILARPRSGLLVAPGEDIMVVVEIADRLVAVTATGTAADPRSGPPDTVADAVVRRVAALIRGVPATVAIDGPGTVGGAAVLAAMIAARLRAVTADATVQVVDDPAMSRLAAAAVPDPLGKPAAAPPAFGIRYRIVAALAGAAVLGAAVVGTGAGRRPVAPVTAETPTMFLVEGRVALEVPAQWQVRRVTGGPGSARVEVTSPSDPRVALHVTQSPVPDTALTATAEALRRAVTRANAAESAEVFVGFDPAGNVAGRPAVTYREERARHHIDWTVLVDGAVRISIGCQSSAGGADAMRAVCEQAVRSAHAVT